MTTDKINKLTELLSEIITDSIMTDDNTCACCWSDIQIQLSETDLSEIVELVEPKLLPFLRARLETVARKF